MRGPGTAPGYVWPTSEALDFIGMFDFDQISTKVVAQKILYPKTVEESVLYLPKVLDQS